MKLYDVERSGNCYKIRLMLAFLDVDYEKVPVDVASGQNRRPEFLKLSPRGQIPVFDTGEKVIWDSTAILIYLARRFGGESWLPLQAEQMAEVMQWLALAQNEMLTGLARARAIKKMGRAGNLEEAQNAGAIALNVIESRLKEYDWVAIDRVTVADVACYPYVALAPEGGLSLGSYPGVLAWMGRIQKLPRYCALPQL